MQLLNSNLYFHLSNLPQQNKFKTLILTFTHTNSHLNIFSVDFGHSCLDDLAQSIKLYTYIRIYFHICIQGETDAQHQQPMEYAVVDKSKKKNIKGDKQQNVSTYILQSFSMTCA